MDFGKLDQEGLNMLHDTETLWTKGDESITLPYKIPRQSSKLHLNVLALYNVTFNVQLSIWA